MTNPKKIIPKKSVYKTTKQHRSIASYVKDYRMAIFIIIVGMGLAACIILLNGLLKYTYGGDKSVNRSSSASSQFDQATMQRVNQLNVSSQNTINTSSAAKSPFSED